MQYIKFVGYNEENSNHGPVNTLINGILSSHVWKIAADIQESEDSIQSCLKSLDTILWHNFLQNVMHLIIIFEIETHSSQQFLKLI